MVSHEEHVDYITMLNTDVGSSSRNVIEVRHVPGSNIPTFVRLPHFKDKYCYQIDVSDSPAVYGVCAISCGT